MNTAGKIKSGLQSPKRIKNKEHKQGLHFDKMPRTDKQKKELTKSSLDSQRKGNLEKNKNKINNVTASGRCSTFFARK